MNKDEEIDKPKVFEMSRFLIVLMSVASGVTAANLYYAQPLGEKLSQFFNVSSTLIGIAAMLIQLGYAMGLVFLVPLGDIKEHRSLIMTMLFCSMIALLGLSFASNVGWFLAGSLLVGLTSVTPMLIVTLAAHLANPAKRGRVIGSVMSGLLIGILLSRTFSGIVGSALGWQAVYRIAAIMMFATFSTFWTTLSFLLKSPTYNLGTQVAGMFGLIGVAGALAATVVGRIADKKSPRFTLSIAIVFTSTAFICFWFFGYRMWGLVLGTILLDLGVQSGQISNQSRINALDASARSRNNAVYMAFYFIGGALGSFLGSLFWGILGWTGVCIVGISFQIIAAIVHFRGMKTEKCCNYKEIVNLKED